MGKNILSIIMFFLSFQCAFTGICKDSTIRNLTLHPYDIEFEYQPKKDKIKNMSCRADWIRLQNKKNKSGTYFIIRITENISNTSRQSTITLKTSKYSRNIEIIQEGQDITSKFPDHNFRKALLKKGIISKTQLIYAREVRDVTVLDLSDAEDNITSISGIEYFKKLRDLD